MLINTGLVHHRANQGWTPPTEVPAGQEHPSGPQDMVDLSGLKGVQKFVHDAGRQLSKVHPAIAGVVGTIVGSIAAGPLAGIAIGLSAAWGSHHARKAEAAMAQGKEGVRQAMETKQPFNSARAGAVGLSVALGAACAAAALPAVPALAAVLGGGLLLGHAAGRVGQEIARQANS